MQLHTKKMLTFASANGKRVLWKCSEYWRKIENKSGNSGMYVKLKYAAGKRLPRKAMLPIERGGMDWLWFGA